MLTEDQITDNESVTEQHQHLVDQRACREKQNKTFAEFFTQFKENFRSARTILLSLFWVFMLTFIIFPGAFLDSYFDFINNTDLSKDEKLSWYFIALTLLFNVFDTIGRFLGGSYMISTRTIVTSSLLRTAFAVTTTLIAFAASPSWLF